MWTGYSAAVWPRSVRFYADETLKDLSGVVQETPKVVLPDMRQWDGSIKIIDLGRTGGTSDQTSGRFSTKTAASSDSTDTSASDPGGIASTAPVVVVSSNTTVALPPPSVFVPAAAPVAAAPVDVWPEEPAPAPAPTPTPTNVPSGARPATISNDEIPLSISLQEGTENPGTSVSDSGPDGLTSRLES